MKNSEYLLFPQSKSQTNISQKSQAMFNGQQSWKQGGYLTERNEQMPRQQPAFFNSNPVVNRVLVQQPIKYIVPQQYLPIQQVQIPQQVQQQVLSSQQFNQQPNTNVQQIQNSVQQQNQQQQIQKQQQMQPFKTAVSQVQQQNQQPFQQQQHQQQQMVASNNIANQKKELMKDMVISNNRTERTKEIEQKIHQEILSQSKRLNTGDSMIGSNYHARLRGNQSPRLCESIKIHDNSLELHLSKSQNKTIFEKKNEHGPQGQKQSNQLNPSAYYLPTSPSTYKNSSLTFVPHQNPLISSQVRIIQPQSPFKTIIRSQALPVSLGVPVSTIVPTKTSQVILNTITQPSMTTVVTNPSLPVLSTLQGSPNKVVLSNSNVRLSTMILSPHSISQVGNTQQQFKLSNGFANKANTDRNIKSQPNEIQSQIIPANNFFENLTTRGQDDNYQSNKTQDINETRQHVRQIIEQSKFILQKDILPQNEKLNKEFYGLKKQEKQSVQNKRNLEERFKEFEKRRQLFNQKLKQYNSIDVSNSGYLEYAQPNPQPNESYYTQQYKAQNTSQNSNHQVTLPYQTGQKTSTVNQVLSQLINSTSQQLKQPILNEYEQSLIFQQQSTSSFPASSRQHYQQQANLQKRNEKTEQVLQEQQNQINEEYRKEFEQDYQQEQQENYIRQQNQDLIEQEKQLYKTQEEEDEDEETNKQEQSTSNQVTKQQQNELKGSDNQSQQHEQFKQKFQKTKDQFYQEKSQLSDRQHHQQQNQNNKVQSSQNQQQNLQQEKQQVQQEKQQVQQEKLQVQQEKGKLNEQTIQHQQFQQSYSNEQRKLSQDTVSQSIQNKTVNSSTVENNQSNLNNHNIYQSQQQNHQREQDNKKQISSPKNFINETTSTVVTKQETFHKQQSNSNHVEASSEVNQQKDVQQSNIAESQQQYLQNRGDINQLFLQSLENQYQQQFEDDGEEQYNEGHQQDQNSHKHDNQNEQNIQYSSHQGQIQNQNQQFDEFDQNFLSSSQQEQNYQIADYNNGLKSTSEQVNFSQFQQQYQQARGQANEQFMQTIYTIQSTNQQQKGDDLLNFDDFQQTDEDNSARNQKDLNVADLQFEFQQNNQHLSQFSEAQSYHQQVTYQTSTEVRSSQYQQHQYDNVNDEERLVMLREQQLIAEKQKREEEKEKQIEQIEQRELLRLSSHSITQKRQSQS